MTSKIKETAHRLIIENQEEQIEALKEVIRLKSVGDKTVVRDGKTYPFGLDVDACYRDFMARGEEMGFTSQDFDGYGGHIEWGKGEEIVGILGHLDVVPEGDGWTFPPYDAHEEDGYIYGRGTTDDKGPMVACLYAMKALKDAGLEPTKRLRLILGLDEETEWKGIEYYLSKTQKPDYGFTPDAEFPVINGEMGMLFFNIAKKLSSNKAKGLKLSALSGGNAPNMVADFARAVVNHPEKEYYDGIREKAERFREETGYKLKLKGIGRSLEITAEGVSAHGAHPYLGLNAISIIMKFLGELTFANEGINEFISFYNTNIGFELNGSSMGCFMEDEQSGELVFNVGMVSLEKEAVSLVINIRYPVTCEAEKVYESMQPVLEQYDLGLIKNLNKDPIFKEVTSPLVKTMMDAYVENTGDVETKPVVTGGGTYARATSNIIAFGGAFPGEEDRMHQRDERISIESFMKMTHIYADAIHNLLEGEL